MVVDGFPHDLNIKKYNQSNKVEIHALNRSYTFNWGFFFSNIYYDESYISLSKEVEGQIEFNKGLISAPIDVAKNLEESFFNKYLGKNICFKKELANEWFYYCKKNKKFNIKEFRSIYLKSTDLEIIFELDYEDLFYEKNNKLYFLICFETDKPEDNKFNEISEWIFGKPFMKKYQFSFDVENRIIRFYENLNGYIHNTTKNTNLKYTYSNILLSIKNIPFIIFFLFIVFLSFLYILKYSKNGKKKSNRKTKIDKNEEGKEYIELEDNLITNNKPTNI